MTTTNTAPIWQRRLQAFKRARRGYISFSLFAIIAILCTFAEFIANDRPIIVQYDGHYYFPIVQDIPETTYGGFFETPTLYTDPTVQALIYEKDGWMLWPPIRYSYNTLADDLKTPAPTAPDANHLLGTDDQARDVFARLIYGFRISIFFGLLLTISSSALGIFIGLLQGYYGGKVDLFGQRIIEIWGGLPSLFLLIIMASLVVPDFWWLLLFLFLFSWTSLTGVVRVEVLRTRNLDYITAARALGMSNMRIMFRHVLPNALVASFTFFPFLASGSITALASLDFLGFGLPPGSASLGEMLKQGKENLHAPWLGLTAFFALGGILTLLVFTGEALRDAFDPQERHRN